MVMRYAYIGGGGTTTALLIQHVRQIAAVLPHLSSPPEITISVYDRGGTFGPGLPFAEDNLDCHLVNMEANTVSIDADDRYDFVRWMREHESELRERYPSLDVSPMQFPPRSVVGRYLSARFVDAEVAAARAGIRVQRIADEVLDIEREGGHLLLHRADGTVDAADRVVIATGHWDPHFGRHCEPLGQRLEEEGRGGYFYPWPARELRARIPAGADVAVAGTSLTAVDVAFTLFDDGGTYVRDRATGRLAFVPNDNCRSVVLTSRNGILPRVRSLWPPPHDDNPYLTKASVGLLTRGGTQPARFDDVIEEFHRRIAHARDGLRGEPLFESRGRGDVTAAALQRLSADLEHAMRPTVQWNRLHYAIRDSYSALARLYPQMTADDQRRFMETFLRPFNAYAGSMPVSNGEKIRALLDSGRLRIVAGLRELRPCARRGTFGLVAEAPNGAELVVERPYLVNAIGQERELSPDRVPLLRALVDRGLATAYRAGGLHVDYDGSNVIEPSGRASESLFAIGAMTLGQRIGSSALLASAKFASAVARRFVSDIIG